MKITKGAKAGTLESCDILIMVSPNPQGGINLNLKSVVIKQYGDVIKETIINKLKEMNVEDINITAQDRGALDYTIRARVETALNRAK